MKKMSIQMAIRLLLFFNGVIVCICGVFDFLYHYLPHTLNKDIHGLFVKSMWPLDLSLMIAGFLSAMYSMLNFDNKTSHPVF